MSTLSICLLWSRFNSNNNPLEPPWLRNSVTGSCVLVLVCWYWYLFCFVSPAMLFRPPCNESWGTRNPDLRTGLPLAPIANPPSQIPSKLGRSDKPQVVANGFWHLTPHAVVPGLQVVALAQQLPTHQLLFVTITYDHVNACTPTYSNVLQHKLSQRDSVILVDWDVPRMDENGGWEWWMRTVDENGGWWLTDLTRL